MCSVTGGGLTVGGAVAGGAAVCVIVWSAYEIVTYRPCHPSGPLTEIGEHIADYFIPIDDGIGEDFEEEQRQKKCFLVYLDEKSRCNSLKTEEERRNCLYNAEVELVKCIGPENYPPRGW